MPRRILALILVLVSAATSAPAQYGGSSGYTPPADPNAMAPRGFEVLMEGGLALPTSNLGAEFLSEDAALGGETGFMLGLRGRIYTGRSFAIAPVFSYTEFGDYDGLSVDGEVFTILARVIRYGVDFSWIKPGRVRQLRPILGAGASLVRNKYREEFVDQEVSYSAGINGFAWSLHGGLRWREWELSVEYQYNTFSTPLFLPTGVPVDYNWSQLTFRFAFALPRI